MQFYVDLIKLDRFLSTLEEELREISRLEGVLERQKMLSGGFPAEEERILERSRFLKKERERIQGRKIYIMKAQELLYGAENKNQSSLENTLQQLRRLNQ